MKAADGLHGHVRRRIFANVRLHVFAWSAQLLISLMLVPYVLSKLSRAEYGLWSWLLGICGYLSLADLGLAQGNLRRLAESLAGHDDRRLGEIVTATIVVNAAVALCAAGLLLLAREGIYALVPPENRSAAGAILWLLLAAQTTTVCGFAFGSLMSAVQRLDVLHAIRVVWAVLQGLLTVAVLSRGYGVIGLAVAQLVLAVFELLARAWVSLAQVPHLRPAIAPTREWHFVWSAGLPLVMLSVAGAVCTGFERVLLGAWVDLPSIAQYAVAFRLIMVARELPVVLLFALTPASAALDVAGDDEALRRLYLQGLKVAACSVMPMIVTLWLCGPLLIQAWVGRGFDAAGRVVMPLAAGLLIPMLTAPGVHIAIGRSRVTRLTTIYVLWTTAFVVLNAVWLSTTEFSGAGWGTAVVNTVGSLCLLRRFHSVETRVGREGWRVLRRAATAAVVAFAAGGAVRLLLASTAPSTRSASALIALVIASVVWATFVVWAERSRLLVARDRVLFLEAVFGARRVRAGGER